MAFIYEYFSTNGWPAVDLGPACWAAKNSIAPSVYDCSPYAPMIQTCQSSGKKVMVSIGGAVGQSSFNSHDQAVTFANNLWNMFGSPVYTNKTFTATDGSAQNWTDFRPFGPSITFDGVDIDNENNNPAYYADFVTALRSNYALDTSGRQYYVSSAPQCPYPDASNPQAMLAQCDFVNVQFYNNPWCNIGSNGFLDSVETWSNFLDNSTYMGANGKGPQLLIGIPALNNVGSGYIAAAQLGQYIDGVKGLELPNFGGIMMWDGTEALNNVDAQGNNFLDAAAATLN
jgi:chitinase